MQPSGWLQFALYFVALVLITKPMGLYLLQVLDANGRTYLDPVLRPLERLTYRVMGVDPNKEHDWKQYTLAMLLFSLAGCLFTYAILRLQNILPLNRKAWPRSARIVRSTPQRVSRPTPIGRATSAKPPS
jgi:K+-transporting ATPase ATPase A chain